MSVNIDQRLHAILANRAKHGQALEPRVAAWVKLASELKGLDASFAALAQHPKPPRGLQGLRAMVQALPPRIEAGVLPRLRRVEARFRRSTINIGVAGEARVGKSTLLQSISGLDDEQIPTGDNLPVTAVRSRIFHVSGASRAKLELRSWSTFRSDVLRPYYERLGWGPVPELQASFQTTKLPMVPEEHADANTLKALRARVSNIQGSMASFVTYLDSAPIELELKDLRPFVSYPPYDADADTASPPDRRYLAVREANIYCDFPGVDVRNIGLVDLPGTGEIVATSEDRLFDDLRDEVDLVLFVVNPNKKAFWSQQAVKTLDLVDRARCGAAPGDFCVLVVNRDRANATQIAAIVSDFKRKTDGAYSVVETNAIDAESVRTDLLFPMLEHLAKRLPAMDEGAIQFALADADALLQDADITLQTVNHVLLSAVPQSTTIDEELDDMSAAKRKDLAADLGELVHMLLLQSRNVHDEDPEFERALEDHYREIRTWIADGLGRTEKAWVEAATKSFAAEKSSATYINDEYNRVRVHLALQFAGIDDHLRGQVANLWGQVVTIVGDHLGIPTGPANERLSQLAGRLRSARCEGLATAVDDLLTLRLDYRTQFHPELRRHLDVLHPQTRDPSTGAEQQRVAVPLDRQGAHEALRLITEDTEKAAYEVIQALRRTQRLPRLVLHAAAEQFDDAFIRSGTSVKELKRFARRYRDEIWPGHFEELDHNHRLYADTMEQLGRVLQALQQAKGA